jgi:hypothetical protein
MGRFTLRQRNLTVRRRASISRGRRLAIERCEPRQMLATDLAWAIPQNWVYDIELDSAANVLVAAEGSIAKYAPAGTLIWSRPAPTATGLAQDAAGNIYATGYFAGTFTFGANPGEHEVTSAGSTDIFVAKFDGGGQAIWARRMGGTSNEYGESIDVDSAGNVAITGEFSGTADFDPGAGERLLTGSDDIFVAKLDSAANLAWAHKLAGLTIDYGDAVSFDSQGDVIVAGRFTQGADFDPGEGTALRFSAGSSDAFVWKLSSAGDLVWVNQLAASGQLDGAFGVVLDENDNIYTTGEFRGAADFDPGPGVYSLTTPSSQADVFLWKMNAAGDFAWARQYGSPVGASPSDYGFDIARDAAGNLYLTGYFNQFQAFIGQFDPVGNPIRIRTLSGSSQGNAIAADAAGNIYAGGLSSGNVDYDPSSGVYEFSSSGYLLRLKSFEADGVVQGRAWNDLDGDGIQDAGEPGLRDVPVQLVRSLDSTFGNADEAVVATTTTAADGSYQFNALDWIYRYFVVSNAPAGFAPSGTPSIWSISPTDQGFDDALDSDLEAASGHTSAITLDSGQTADTDIGFQGTSPGFGWATRTTHGGSEDGKFIARDSVGNVYVLGTITSAQDFDPGPGVMSTFTRGGNEVVLVKYSKSGAFQWVREWATSEADVPGGLAVDAAGNVYVAGSFPASSLSFGVGSTPAVIDTAADAAVGIFKLDPTGTMVWSRYIRKSGSNTNTPRGMVVDSQNNLYLLGEFTGSMLAFAGPALVGSASVKDGYIVKLNTAGDYHWSKQIDNFSSQFAANGIGVDPSGNIYATGTFTGTVDFDPSVVSQTLNAAGPISSFIVKWTSAGSYVWAKQIAGATSRQIAVTKTHLLLTGDFTGTVDFDPSAGGQTNFSSTATTAFVTKLDLDGNFAWARSLRLVTAGITYATGAGVATDAWGNVYVVGSFMGTVDFDSGAGVLELICPGKDDIFVWKLNRLGDFAWAGRTGGTFTDGGRSITVDPVGNVYFTGFALDSFDFDPTSGVFSLGGPANNDLFVAMWLNPSPPLPGDFDGDGDVDGADFVVWQTNFPKASGATIVDGDADGDGDVDGADFVVWQTNFPYAPSPGIAAPVTVSGSASSAPGAEANNASASPSAAPSSVVAPGSKPKAAVVRVPSMRAVLENERGAVSVSNAATSRTQPAAHSGRFLDLPQVTMPQNLRALRVIESGTSDLNALQKRSALSAVAVDYWLQVSTMYHSRHGRRAVAAVTLE